MMILHKMECDPFMSSGAYYIPHAMHCLTWKSPRITSCLLLYMGIRKKTERGSEAEFTVASVNVSLVVFSTFCLVCLHVTFFIPCPLLPIAREGSVFTGVYHSVHNWPHGYSSLLILVTVRLVRILLECFLLVFIFVKMTDRMGPLLILSVIPYHHPFSQC